MAQLLIIFIAHWIGDYALQTTAMAVNKRSSVKWLSIHVMVYATIIFFGFLFQQNLNTALQLAVVNGALHWVTDFFTSKLSYRFKDKPRIFYAVLGFDQLIHTSCLLLTFEKLSR